MKLIDTHCHLADRRLRRNLPAVLRRADDAGVVAVICATADLEESKQAMTLAGRYEQVYFTAGFHPHNAKDAKDDHLRQIEAVAGADKCVAIGEIGLDYHYDFSPPDAQRRVFAQQLELARRLGKPAVVHTREAFDDTLAILAETGFDAASAVFHSFTEGPQNAKRALDMGATIGFSGIVTFKNSSRLRESVRLVGDDRLLIETDSPYLSPEPVRKTKTNEPANVVHVAACLAAVRRTTPEALAELTTANAIRFFDLDINAVGRLLYSRERREHREYK